MTAQQKQQWTIGSVVALLVGIATLVAFLVRPIWAMQQHLQSVDISIQRHEDFLQRMDRDLGKIDGKLDKLIEGSNKR